MNSLLAKNAMKNNGLFSQKTAKSPASATLLTAVILSVISTSTFANRPSMEGHSDTAAAAEPQTQPMAEQNTPQTRPEAEAPSAVEIMMQQQSQQPRQVQQTGDILQLPPKEMQQGETLQIRLLDYPRRGMSMQRVEQEYGQPMATSTSVGQPPITHWTYNDRVVYFEYSTVLHVVAR